MTTFRFAPGCCCSQSEEADVCVPECSLIADRIVLATEEMTIDAAVSASRHCSGEDWWHGFYVSNNYAYPLTVETVTVSGTPRARSVANSVIHLISYANGAVKYWFTQYDSVNYALYYFSSLLNTTNATQASVDNYFVYDSIDQREHYKPSVTEPAWVTISGLPYDYAHCPFHFTYDGTEAGYAAADRQRLVPNGRYKTAAECGFPRLTVSADFTVNETAWSQYHTGTDQVYAIAGEDLDDWDASLADGSHHYGAEKFFVTRLGIGRTNWSWGSDGVGRGFPSAIKEEIEFRFGRDAPTFTPMPPAGKYSKNWVYVNPSSEHYPGVTGYTHYDYGTPAGVPANWKWSPYETPGDIFGEYYALALGVSHRQLATAKCAAANGVMPLGRYTFTPPATTDMSQHRLSQQTFPMVWISEATLDKKVNEWDASDWEMFGAANTRPGAGGGSQHSVLVNGLYTGTPTAWRAWWYRGASKVFGTTDTTPAGVKSGNLAWVHRLSLAAYSQDGGSLRQIEQTLSSYTYGWVNQASAPSADWSLVSSQDADWYGVDISGYNKYGKIEFFDSIRQADLPNNVQKWIPSIPDTLINSVFPAGTYILTAVFSDQEQAGKTYYYFPCIRCGMIAAYI